MYSGSKRSGRDHTFGNYDQGRLGPQAGQSDGPDGIATSLAIVKSNDQSEVRALLPERPRASGFAAIEDIGKVPVTDDAGRQEYQRFLAAKLPRAMALSPDGRAWAWNAGGFDAVNLALTRCAQRSSQTCRLYAVDDDVVWTPK